MEANPQLFDCEYGGHRARVRPGRQKQHFAFALTREAKRFHSIQKSTVHHRVSLCSSLNQSSLVLRKLTINHDTTGWEHVFHSSVAIRIQVSGGAVLSKRRNRIISVDVNLFLRVYMYQTRSTTDYDSTTPTEARRLQRRKNKPAASGAAWPAEHLRRAPRARPSSTFPPPRKQLRAPRLSPPACARWPPAAAYRREPISPNPGEEFV